MALIPMYATSAWIERESPFCTGTVGYLKAVCTCAGAVSYLRVSQAIYMSHRLLCGSRSLPVGLAGWRRSRRLSTGPIDMCGKRRASSCLMDSVFWTRRLRVYAGRVELYGSRMVSAGLIDCCWGAEINPTGLTQTFPVGIPVQGHFRFRV
jgi:hypothetical protein